jgi:flavorubredoxin
MITNSQSGTRIDEIADGIHRISTPVPPAAMPGGFSFNQYLVLDDEPLLFHTGMRSLFPLVREAIAALMPIERLRYVALSHFEADECGALNDFLQAAPQSVPVCSKTAEMVSVNDFALRPARSLADGEHLSLGHRTLQWIDTPHLPHNWETGLMFDIKTQTLLCGDLFTQGGHELPATTFQDLVGPSEAFRRQGVLAGQPDAFSHGPDTAPTLQRLAALRPHTLAVMHGSVFQGRHGDDGANMLRNLAKQLAA